MSAIVTLGETMALFVPAEIGRLRDMTGLRLTIAGAESNVAIGVVRLGHDASWIGRVGEDEFGQMILGVLRKEGIDVSHAVVDPSRQTALMFKERRTTDVVRVTYYRHGYAGSCLSPDDVSESTIAEARILHVTGVTLGLSPSARAAVYRAVEIAHANDVVVSFDFNYRAALWGRAESAVELARMAKCADVIFAGEDELALLSEEQSPLAIAHQLHHSCAAEIVVKQGAQGAAAITASGTYEAIAPTVRVVDPVGAGDAFVAGYLAGILEDKGPEDRLRQACGTGAFAVTGFGDWEAAPSKEDLDLLRYGAGTTLR